MKWGVLSFLLLVYFVPLVNAEELPSATLQQGVCCICRYQADDWAASLFRLQCNAWLASQAGCTYNEVQGVNRDDAISCQITLPPACQGRTTVLRDHYIGHFTSADTQPYLDGLFKICIEESCTIDASNSGCSALRHPEFIQQYIRDKVPADRWDDIRYRGMQCTSTGEADMFCSNTECTVTAYCVEFPSCNEIPEGGLCIDPPNERARCVNANGEVEPRVCCGRASIPGFGYWRRGDSCDDISQTNCLRGCCSCGTDPSSGQPCKYCQDNPNIFDQLPLVGSYVTVIANKWIEKLDCSGGVCELYCTQDLEGSTSYTANRGSDCGTYIRYLPNGIATIKKDCNTGTWTFTHQGRSTNAPPGAEIKRIVDPSCSAEDVRKFNEANQILGPPEPRNDCTGYSEYVWCGGEKKALWAVHVKTKNTATCA